jgi:hypothetical protein
MKSYRGDDLTYDEMIYRPEDRFVVGASRRLVLFLGHCAAAWYRALPPRLTCERNLVLADSCLKT